MSKKKEFYTFRGYTIKEYKRELTASMEDYLEMIYRLSQAEGYTRINELASAVNVQPSSASKMVQKLTEANFLKYEKYSIIKLTKKGNEMGSFLLKRHNTIESFLKHIGVTEGILEDTEKIEHNISNHTMERIAALVELFDKHPEILRLLDTF